MIAALARLAPQIVLLLGLGGGALTGAGAAWFARGFVVDTIEKPALERAITQRERDACTIRTQAAAQEARAAAELRWREVAEDARQAGEELDMLRDAQRLHVIDNLNREIAENERRIAAEGRSCPLDDATADWLRHQWGLPAGD